MYIPHTYIYTYYMHTCNIKHNIIHTTFIRNTKIHYLRLRPQLHLHNCESRTGMTTTCTHSNYYTCIAALQPQAIRFVMSNTNNC